MSDYDGYYYGALVHPRTSTAGNRPDEFTPIPGNPGALRESARALTGLADRMIATNGIIDTGMQTALRDWQSERAQKFAESALTLTTATPSVELRLRGASTALTEYANALEDAQQTLARQTQAYDRTVVERNNAPDCQARPEAGYTNSYEGATYQGRLNGMRQSAGQIQSDLKTKAQQLAIALYGQAAQCVVVEQAPTPAQLLGYIKEFGNALGEPHENLRDAWSPTNAGGIVLEKPKDVKSHITALKTWKKLGVYKATGVVILSDLEQKLFEIYDEPNKTRLGAYAEIQTKLNEYASKTRRKNASTPAKKLQEIVDDFAHKMPQNVLWASKQLPVPVIGTYFDVIDILDPDKSAAQKFIAGLSIAGSACEVLAATALVSSSTAFVLSTFGIGAGIIVLGWFVYENRESIADYLDSLWEPEKFPRIFLPQY